MWQMENKIWHWWQSNHDPFSCKLYFYYEIKHEYPFTSWHIWMKYIFFELKRGGSRIFHKGCVIETVPSPVALRVAFLSMVLFQKKIWTLNFLHFVELNLSWMFFQSRLYKFPLLTKTNRTIMRVYVRPITLIKLLEREIRKWETSLSKCSLQ